MDVTRVKNQLIKAVLEPQNMMFDVRLHQEEMLPDGYVHCFRDFEKWLTKDTPFSKPDRARFPDLDAIALSPPEEARTAYPMCGSFGMKHACVRLSRQLFQKVCMLDR